MTKAEMLRKRTNRCIAKILGYKEDYIDDDIDEETSDEFRSLILDAINDVSNLAVDLLDDASIMNELFIERMEAVINGEEDNGS